MPRRRPTSSEASCWNAVGERSTLPGAHPGQVSTTVAVTVLPSGPVTTIWRPHIGLLEERELSLEAMRHSVKGRGDIRVGVRGRAREVGDSGDVDGDNEVGIGVLEPTGAEAGGVEGSCHETVSEIQVETQQRVDTPSPPVMVWE